MIQSTEVTTAPEATLKRVGGQPHGGNRAGAQRPSPARARKRRRAVLGAGAIVAGAAFLTGLVLGAQHVPSAQRSAERFAAAWQRGDYAAMYSELSERERARVRRSAFTSAYQRALHTATARRVVAGPTRRDGDAYRIPVRIDTRIFGTIRGAVRVPVGDAGVDWSRDLVFPGLRRRERLSRRTWLPERAALLARDKTPLARGSARSSPLGPVASALTGVLGPIPADRRAELARLGVPPDAVVGASGLERIFDTRLLGRPGGDLRAGGRLLAHAEPQRAEPVRTTISTRVQAAAVDALGPRLGGVLALDPRSGAVLGAAGIALSGLQPPGSTFKIITVTGALEARLTRPSTRYPVQTEATLEGVEIENANGEACGGTLVASFAESCNSVFAPLGARLGAERLVDVAERFGFNHDPGVPGAAMSTIPAAEEIGDDLAVGSSAIGQGRVQATALQMAVVAATIGLRGRRPRPTLDFGASRAGAPTTRATSARTAGTVERLMLAVVRGGTGTAAAIPGVKVAGKTGTAELKTTVRCEPDPANPEACPEQQPDDPSDTDAWFAAYAPAGDGRPRVAVGVMLVGAGAGGDTAAPAAQDVLAAALAATSQP
ncbi:MAG TPA: penicillin-binding transpeptidase domain-containing protein [Solirubrobacteraceae bacterium]|nr:penicillin-binding transpeptidase domain-containing protein [Solirubrobacteraceae bacterium]